ncbi:hypothetical protein BZA03_1191, partial [Alteromonas sp. I10]|uniref:hypothetical protein n=1 Tax=Alteromonas sp. I10 TaxID=1938740 RepID=UPI000DA0D4B0
IARKLAGTLTHGLRHFVPNFSPCVIALYAGVSTLGAGSLKVKPSKKLYLKMLRSLLIISVLFGLTAYVWSTSVYECISIFSWDFCGSIGQAELIYPLFALDVLLAFYLLSPFFTYFSYREIIKNRNKIK